MYYSQINIHRRTCSEAGRYTNELVFLSPSIPSSNYIRNMGDASGNNRSTNDFFQRGKKRRTDLEEITPTQSLLNVQSDQTDAESDGDLDRLSVAGLSSDNGSNTANPTIQLTGTSVETIVTPTQMDREKEMMARKLDRLKDKHGRYVSHVTFIKKCLEQDVIPNGLSVWVEPSIGNRDEAFLNKWHERMKEFSKVLANDVLEWSEATLSTTKGVIDDTTKDLKSLVTTKVYNDIQSTLEANDRIRNNALTARKNKKFYQLKFGNRDLRSGNNDDRNTQSGDNRGDRQTQRAANKNVIYSNQGYRGTRQRSNDNMRDDNRNRGGQSNNATGHQLERRESHDTRVLAAIERRTRDQEAGPSNRVDNRPIHERIAIAKRPSRRNMRSHSPREDTAQRNNNGNRMNNTPREENMQVNTREDFPRLERNNDKDREIAALRNKVEQLQRNRTGAERVLSHYSNDEIAPPKNATGAQKGPSSDQLNLDEMRNYIQGALATLNGFSQQLNKATGSAPTPTDRS